MDLWLQLPSEVSPLTCTRCPPLTRVRGLKYTLVPRYEEQPS